MTTSYFPTGRPSDRAKWIENTGGIAWDECEYHMPPPRSALSILHRNAFGPVDIVSDGPLSATFRKVTQEGREPYLIWGDTFQYRRDDEPHPLDVHIYTEPAFPDSEDAGHRVILCPALSNEEFDRQTEEATRLARLRVFRAGLVDGGVA